MTPHLGSGAGQAIEVRLMIDAQVLEIDQYPQGCMHLREPTQ